MFGRRLQLPCVILLWMHLLSALYDPYSSFDQKDEPPHAIAHSHYPPPARFGGGGPWIQGPTPLPARRLLAARRSPIAT